jgi:CubicO group peptidase (beta-lactamase class C family)
LKKRLFGLCAILIAFALLIHPPLAAGKKEPRLDPKDFSAFVHKTLSEWKVPGVAIAVVKEGKVILAEGYGFRDIKNQLKVTPQTLFAIGSSSKAFTATAVGILVDEGKLDWNKRVRDYLPTFQLQDEFATEQMTPRDLLCHRSGLPRHDLVWYGSSLSRKELFDRMRYLEPLGMKDSDFSVEDSRKQPDHTLPYGEKDDKVTEIPFRNLDAMGPAGSINSNVLDMAQWVLLNLNKGKAGDKQVISEASLAEIHSPQMVV